MFGFIISRVFVNENAKVNAVLKEIKLSSNCKLQGSCHLILLLLYFLAFEFTFAFIILISINFAFFAIINLMTTIIKLW